MIGALAERVSLAALVRAAFERAGVRLIDGTDGMRAGMPDGTHDGMTDNIGDDIVVRDPRFYRRVALDGSLGIGESYVDGWWDCRQLDVTLHRLLVGLRDAGDAGLMARAGKALAARAGRVWQRQTEGASRRYIAAHYDLGDDFYRAMLGPTMTYSCGYWRHADDLDAAQRDKHALICRKLGIEPGHRVLDIGCGWGGFVHHAASTIGCRVVGITLSAPQAEYARARCRGLPVEIERVDYRALDPAVHGRFDRVVSVGMFEHVGRAYYPTFMEAVRRVLTDDGLALLHTIGRHRSAATEPWINRYIFPGGMLPSLVEIAAAAEPHFVVEDWHDFRADYDRTLMAWHHNMHHHGAAELAARGRAFERMWSFYLCAFAANFRAGDRHQLWQVVLSPHGVEGGYHSVRDVTHGARRRGGVG